MKVALDARRLQDQPRTGVGRALANLVPHLAEEVEPVLLTDRRRSLDGLADFVDVEVVALPCPDRLPEPYWLQVSVARWLRGFDGIFHGTYNAVPFRCATPSVVTIHDLSWEHHSEDLSWAKRHSFRTQARWSARHSAAILTVSEYMRAAIIDTYGVRPDAVLVAPNAVDPVFSPRHGEGLAALLQRLNVDDPYVVALGGAARRGLEVALKAWRRLPGEKPGLVVVGPGRVAPQPGLVQLERLSDTDWAILLAGALAFCYPTRYEGFGMPALEAAASGTPVVCARVGPLPDILGDAAEWCRTPTADDVAPALAHVVADEERRTQLREAGLARVAAAPTWSQSAAAVLRAYRVAAA